MGGLDEDPQGHGPDGSVVCSTRRRGRDANNTLKHVVVDGKKEAQWS